MKRTLFIFAAIIAIVMLAAVMYGLAQADTVYPPTVTPWRTMPGVDWVCYDFTDIGGGNPCMSVDWAQSHGLLPTSTPIVMYPQYPGVTPEYPGLFDVQAQEAEPEPVATRMVIVDNRRSR